MSKNFIPEWTSTNDQDTLELYLAALKEAARLKICESERMLIFSSLQKSNKMHIFCSLTENQKNSITEFATFIRKNYDLTSDEQRAELASMIQKSDESEQQFLRRVEKRYFQTKGIEVPETLLDWQKSDIKHIFTCGIQNPEIKKYLLLNDIEYEHLGHQARKISQNMKNLTSQVYSVNNIREPEGPFSHDETDRDTESESSVSESDDYEERLNILEQQINNLQEQLQLFKSSFQ